MSDHERDALAATLALLLGLGTTFAVGLAALGGTR